MRKILSKILIWMFMKVELRGEDKAKVLSALLKNLKAIPIQEVITLDQKGVIMVNGKYLDVDKAIHLRESLTALKDNPARKLIHEQLKWKANIDGIASQNLDQLIFSKAALWYLMSEEELLEKLNR